MGEGMLSCALSGRDIDMDDGRHGETRGIAGRHWRGDLGLTRLLWMPAALFAAILALCVGLVIWAPAAVPPMPAFFLKLLAWIVSLAAAAWLFLGLFRAGLGHGRRGGSRALGYGGAAAAALGMIAGAALGTDLAKADLGCAMRLVQANLPITTEIRVLDGGAELLFDGDIEHGAAKALREVAARSPHVTRIRLGGMGGELREAVWMRDFIAEKGWDTHTSTRCWSGCAIAYLGGARRTMSPRAQMGFHSASVWPVRDEKREAALNADIARQMIDRGVEPGFARRAWSKHHGGMWFPSAEELVGAGLVHEITGP